MSKEYKIISQLKNFYNIEAEKFSLTRKKKWPEFNFILDEIKSYSKEWKVKILELWCWDGRFYWYLKENLDISFDYVWVDISDNLINIAKSKYKWDKYANFVVDEMFNYLKIEEQQKYDFVILIASFQHIPSENMRLSVLKGIYKVLNYWGKVIMTNWSFSKWFLKKYWKEIIKSFFRSVLTFGNRKWNDINVPWKTDKWVVLERYYHIFTLSELKSLLNLSWFIIEKSFFIDKFWKNTLDWRNARNSFIVWKKDILYI